MRHLLRLSALFALAFVLSTGGVSAQGAGLTELTSLTHDGRTGDNGSSTASVSGDGRYVAFVSWAGNMVPGDTNGCADVFVRDRETGQTSRVSVSSVGAQANGPSREPHISPDGRYVAFTSGATNLVAVDNDGWADLFVHDRQTGQTRLVAVHEHSHALPDAYAYLGGESFSANSQFLSFRAYATALDKQGKALEQTYLFLYDTQAGAIEQVLPRRPDGYLVRNIGGDTAVSADGRYVAFDSIDYLSSGDANGTHDIFLYDRVTDQTSYVSVSSGGQHGNGPSQWQSISADGRFVAFQSLANNLVAGDTNASYDIFVRDTWLRSTVRVSITSGGAQGDYSSTNAVISADGRYVAFESEATNLVPGDTNYARDVFVHDRYSGQTTLASLAADGTQGNQHSTWPSISTNGLHVAFQSIATNLVPGQGVRGDVFMRIRSDTPSPTGPAVPTLTLDLPEGPVEPDGVTQVEITALLRDASGKPSANVDVTFALAPALGQLSAVSARTGADGRATVRYTAPRLKDLGDEAEVTVWAFTPQLGSYGPIRFKPPSIFHEAVPRFYQAGWEEWRALLPPDSGVHAILKARLTYQGKPVTDYAVTLTILPRDGAYDGDFLPDSTAVAQEPHRLTVLSDGDGWVVAAYQTSVQASRSDVVLDEVSMTAKPFGYLTGWLVETGMDLEVVDVHRLGEDYASYVVLGQPEPLQIQVRDRLHPNYLLSYYNNRELVVDPDFDQFMGVRLDVSHAATQEEFLRLLDIPYQRVPRMTSYDCYFYPASGKDFLHTSAAGNLDGRPSITPWIEGTSIYWLEAHLRLKVPSQLVKDTRAPASGGSGPRMDPSDPSQPNNNCALVALFSNEVLNAMEQFFKDNPCATGNSDYTRSFKCVLGILSVLPATQTIAYPAKVALSLCEAVFDWWNGKYANAAVGTGAALSDDLSIYLDRNPVIKYGTDFTKNGATALSRLSQIDAVVNCFWVYQKFGQTQSLAACGLLAAAAPSHEAEIEREMDLMVQGVLAGAAAGTDLLAVIGADTVAVTRGATAIPTSVDDYGWSADLTAFSLVKDGYSYFLLPHDGSYSVQLQASGEVTVLLYRRGADVTSSSRVAWQDLAAGPRTGSLSFDAGSAPAMSIGGRTVPPVSRRYVDSPAAITVQETGPNGVRVNWSAVAGATGYRVHYGTESRYHTLFPGYGEAVAASQPAADITGLALEASAYYFTVTALSGSDESLYSVEVVAGRASRPQRQFLPVVVTNR